VRGRLLCAVVVAAAGAFTAGCGNSYDALTAPPPGLTAALNNDKHAIRISTGVALAFACTRGPCSDETSAADVGIARLYPAALDTLRAGDPQQNDGSQPQRAWVVVGVAQGSTSLRAGGDDLSVTVLPPGS
jgi:hypothetical protein